MEALTVGNVVAPGRMGSQNRNQRLHEGDWRQLTALEKHLTTGQEAAVRADVVFEAQSVIKLALAIRSYQLADDGHDVQRGDTTGCAGE